MRQKQYTLIEIDEREESYIITKVWATNFTIIKIGSNDTMLVYNHPVYSSVSQNYDQEQDLIMSVRKRWTIIYTNELLRTCYLKFNNVEVSEQIYLLEYHFTSHNNNTNSLTEVQARKITIITVT